MIQFSVDSNVVGFFLLFFFCGVKKLNCIKQFVVVWCSICFPSQIIFRMNLFLFGFKKTLQCHHKKTKPVQHRFDWNVKISAAVDSFGIILHLSEAPHQTPSANLISAGVCFSNCILLHLNWRKQMHQVIWVQTSLWCIHAVFQSL